MKYVSLALTQPPDERHPMHDFVVATDGYETSRLLEMNVLEDGHWTSLFHVVGWPIEPYETALETADDVIEYEISARANETFYLHVHNAPTDMNEQFITAGRQRGLVTVGPIEFREEGTIRLTMVGPGDVIQRALEEIPDDVGVDVRSIGEYHARHFSRGSELTDRQYEAVAAAVDCGYYEEPRSGSVADVAAELDCAAGTAAELLRRAESTVMNGLVADQAGAPQ